MTAKTFYSSIKRPLLSAVLGIEIAMLAGLFAIILQIDHVYQGYDANGTHFGYGGCGCAEVLWWPCYAPITSTAAGQLAIFGIVAGLFSFFYWNAKVTLKSFVYIPMMQLLSLALGHLAVSDNYAYATSVPDSFIALTAGVSSSMLLMLLLIQWSDQKKNARILNTATAS